MDIRISKPVCFSQVGHKDNQEDALFPMKGSATDETRVFIVCDGMGGHEHGEVASQSVASVIGRFTSNIGVIGCEELKGIFASGLAKAYAELNRLDTSDDIRKMGTTLTFLGICSDGILAGHIGDSRIYQFRPGTGIVFQTRDHSLVNDLVAIGEITEEEARNHPRRNVITRAVMPHSENPSKATVKVLNDIRPGDVFFLCTDGVVEKHTNDDLMDIILGEGSLDERISRLGWSCQERDTRDNYTAYAFEVTATGVESVAVASAEVAEAMQPVEYEATEAADVNNSEEDYPQEDIDKNNNTADDMKSKKTIAAVLAAIIVLGLAYMAIGSGHEKMILPNTSRANMNITDEDTTNYFDEETLVQEGLPELENAKAEVTTVTTADVAGTTPAGVEGVDDTNTDSEVTAAEIATPPVPQIQKKNVTSKKVIENVKEEKAVEAQITE